MTHQRLPMITRRTWLTIQVTQQTGMHWLLAMEAVASTAIEHPEWDMDEAHTWSEWEKLTAARTRPARPRRSTG